MASGVGFMTIPPQAWWPRYWALADILVTAQDRSIEDLVGPDRVMQVEDYLAQNVRNVEQRAEALIARARQRLAQYRAGTLSARIQAEWRANPGLTLGLLYYADAECPVCRDAGVLEGEDGSN